MLYLFIYLSVYLIICTIEHLLYDLSLVFKKNSKFISHNSDILNLLNYVLNVSLFVQLFICTAVNLPSML